MAEPATATQDEVTALTEKIVQFRNGLPEDQHPKVDYLVAEGIGEQDAWQGEAPSQDELKAVGQKLESYRDTLSEREQHLLDSMMAGSSVMEGAEVEGHLLALSSSLVMKSYLQNAGNAGNLGTTSILQGNAGNAGISTLGKT